MFSVEEAAQRTVEWMALARDMFPIDTNRDLVPPDLINNVTESSQEFSLVNLCCKEVIRDTNFLKEISTCLPINRYTALMKEAIRQEHYESAAFLMSSWPSATISMSEVIPGVLDTFRILVPYSPGFGYLLIVAKGLNLLMEIFLDVMKNNSLSLLRVLDLRGLYLDEDVLKRLIREINSLSKVVSRNYHIIIDCKITTKDTVDKLISFLKRPRDSDRIKVSFHFSKLDVCQLAEATCRELLELIDSTELTGLSIPPIYSTNFSSFILEKFLSLTMLDISLTHVYLTESKDEILPLRLIRNLRRFSACGGQNDLSAIIPTSILQKLEYLDFTNFQPEEKLAECFHYLASVPLCLRELKLRGFNVVKSHLSLWRNLLRSLAPTLRMLELEMCFRNDCYFETFVIYMLSLVNLNYVDLCLNRLSMKTLLEHATKLGVLSQLKIMTLPYKYTTEELMSGNIPDDDPNKLNCEEIDKRLKTKKSPAVVVNWLQGPYHR